MPHKFDTRQRQRLLSEERYEALHPESLLRDLGLKQGDTVADIGSGPGFFTIPAAQIVGERGLVLAADVQGEMLSAVKGRVTEHGLTNVRVVKTSETDVPLPPESCDFVLLAFVLDEIEQRSRFLHRVARLLKPDGRIVVLEWNKEEQTEGPPIEDRISEEELTADAQAAGLRISESRELNDHQYLCVLTSAKH
ncbi:MAG TPA: methyltransferase domain-containing protein [Ktedonobacterales bacterium]